MVAGFYDEKAYHIGAASRSGWRSEIDRCIRISWASLTLDLIEPQPQSLVDLGCADGALVKHLQSTNLLHYIGVDAHAPFLHAARSKYPSRTWILGDLRDHTVGADVVVAIGTTVGNTKATAVEEIYAFARRSGARAILVTGPTGTGLDDAIVAIAPPPLEDGWHRTFGPTYAGEVWWVDATERVATVSAEACFVRATGLVDDALGSRAMVAARLGLADELARLVALDPTNEGVLLALDYFDALR